jgi:hypothetical protein
MPTKLEVAGSGKLIESGRGELAYNTFPEVGGRGKTFVSNYKIINNQP